MMTVKTIRKATLHDLPVLTQILNEALAYKLEQDDDSWKQEWTIKGVGRWLEKSEMYLIEQENTPVATVSLSWQDEKYWGHQDPVAGYVHRLAVRTGYHGLGIGSFALDWSEQQVRARNRHYLRLTCDYRNTRLCAYYEQHGFISTGIRPIPELHDYVASQYEKNLVSVASSL